MSDLRFSATCLCTLGVLAGLSSGASGTPQRFPVVVAPGPLGMSGPGFRAAMELLGIQVDQYTYSVPFTHGISLRAEVWQGGTRETLARMELSPLLPGTQVIAVATRESGSALELAFRCGPAEAVGEPGSSGSARARPIPLGERRGRTRGCPGSARLVAGTEIPLWVFGAGDSVSSIRTAETIDDYAKRTDLVVVVYVTLLG
ncbi:hypothetical protein JXA88_15060 [Candidatus Fermentibacteria bacterium]|nr:hypothetical protein [Candidatus Fermentibacteria bacterium]